MMMQPVVWIFVPLAFWGLTLSAALWGLALGSIPVILHLLHKRKYRETSWAAMRFLLEAARKHSRRLRLEQLLLLLVRIAILVFLAFALQGLYGTTTTARSLNDGPVQHVLVLDASGSMQYRHLPDCSVFVRAKEAALRIVDSAKRGDLFQLMLIHGNANRIVVRRPTRSRRSFRKMIGETTAAGQRGGTVCAALSRSGLQPTEEVGRLLSSLTDARRLLTADPAIATKRIYLISDFQRVTWLPSSPTLRDEIRRVVGELSGLAQVNLIDVGVKHPDNVAVTDLRAAQTFAISGREVRLQVTVQHFGTAPPKPRKLTLLVDQMARDTRTVRLKAGETKVLDWVYPPRAGSAGGTPLSAAVPHSLAEGDHVFEVRLEDDALPLDNRRWLVLPTFRRLRVLLVDGRLGGRERDRATFFLQRALRPSTTTEEWQGVIEPRVIGPADLMGTDLSAYSCVFLCEVPTIRENEARKLQTYVESGGALIIGLGEGIDRNDYNAKLYRDGMGILPGRLTGLAGTSAGNASAFFRFDTEQLNHPIVEQFAGNPGTGLENVLTFRYVRVALPASTAARVVLRFQRQSDGQPGEPAIIDAPYAAGRVILITTSLAASRSARWSTWCLSASFPALMNEMVFYSLSGRWRNRQGRVGEPIVRAFPVVAEMMPAAVTISTSAGTTRTVPLLARNRVVVRPGGTAFYANPSREGKERRDHIPGGTILRQLSRTGAFLQVRWRQETGWISAAEVRKLSAPLLFFDDTAHSGVYELQLSPPLGRGRERYAVNPPPEESLLQRVSEQSLRNEVLTNVSFRYHRDRYTAAATPPLAATQQSTPTRWFLLAVFGLLLVELLMAWRFSAGLFLLALLIAFEMTRWASAAGLWAGVGSGCLLFGGLLVATCWVYRQQHRKRQRSFTLPGP